MERARLRWDSPMRMARRPPGARRPDAVRMAWSNFSTARRVTRLARWGMVSARALRTVNAESWSARPISRRNVDFLPWLSIRVSWRCGAQYLMGSPGNPAPLPRSKTSSAVLVGRGCRGKRWRAAKRDSPKWRVTISSGVRRAVRFMCWFQRRSRSRWTWMLVTMGSSSSSEGMKGARSSRRIAGSMLMRIHAGGEEAKAAGARNAHSIIYLHMSIYIIFIYVNVSKASLNTN